MTESIEPSSRPPLRLWPGVVAVTLQWLGILLRVVDPELGVWAMLGAVVLGLVVIVWWLFFSRAPWWERLGALAVIGLAVVATRTLVHPSISNAGMGRAMYIFSIPLMCLALVVWAVTSRGLAGWPRRAALLASVVAGCGVLALLRTGGVTGDGGFDFHWRWTPTAEERLLARSPAEPAAPAPAPTIAPTPDAAISSQAPDAAKPEPAAPAAKAPPKSGAAVPDADTRPKQPAPETAAAASAAEWPGFRGPARDGVVRGVRIETDWSKTPPVRLWRQPVGPGWSSFAVHGSHVYTQEQRGDNEDVSCYELSTGRLLWRHRDATRFWESNAGPGPRGTPTLDAGRVYTLGATGVLNALDAATGARAWSRNVATDTGVEVPTWGFASSPLVVDGLVVVAASGRLAAYDAATGASRWQGPTGGGGYSSPQLVTISGVPQILLLRGARSTSVAPADGTLLWEHSTGQPSASILQPAVVEGGDILVAAGDMMGGTGIRRLSVAHGPGGWSVQERWATRGLKPYFNDFVAHEGHAYGFDGAILACVDLANGTRKWKGGRYGNGQLLLLPEQDLLLVTSEQGELALVVASPDAWSELSRVPAIEGKTWNHPVLVGDVLLVRNGEEMAAFRIPLAGT
jgi:outer membrane protein assembly factor BamB